MTDETKTDKSESSSEGDGKAKGTKTLNELLADWDGDGNGEQSKAKKTESKGPSTEDLAAELADLRLEQQMPKYLEVVKGDTGMSDKVARGLIAEAIYSDEKFAKLWDARQQNQSRFLEALKAINNEFADEFKKMDPKKESRKSPSDDLTAAVRAARTSGSSDSSFDNIDWATLSDAEFAKKKSEVFRAAKAGAFS